MLSLLRILVELMLVAAFSGTITNKRSPAAVCQAWIPPADTASSRRSSQRCSRSVLWAVTPKNKNNNDEDDQAILSDLDARVLQEMLQSDKLDLEKEANMKKLLERGIKKEDDDDSKFGKKQPIDEEETEFSSEIMKTLGNTKLWKGFKRNAKDWLESLSVIVQNRVERDAKLLASLGIFAFDRALQDVQRALPAVSKVVQDRISKTPISSRLLSSTSSFQNQTKATTTQSIRDEMTTPADEWKSIQQDVKEIFSAADSKTISTGSGTADKTTMLRSAAPSNKFSKERFQKAYQKQKQTTLKREKENLAQSSTRVASNIIDSAWQVKRELEIEPNQPGYKTKALRESVSAKANLLAEGATRFIAARTKKKDDQQMQLPETASTSESIMDVEIDVPSSSSETTPTPKEVKESTPSMSTPITTEQQQQQQKVIFDDSIFVAKKLELQDSLRSELFRVATDMEYMIQNPEKSWMDADLISDQLDELRSASLEAIVTKMVQSQREIMLLAEQQQQQQQQQDDDGVEMLLQNCEKARVQLHDLFDLVNAEIPSTAIIQEYLQRRLIYGKDYREEEEGLPTLMKIDLLRREWKILQEEQELERMKAEFMAEDAAAGATVVEEPYGVDDEPIIEYFDVKETEMVADDDEILQRHEKEDPVSFYVYGDDDEEEDLVREVEETKPRMEIMDVIAEATIVVDDDVAKDMSSSSSSAAAAATQDVIVDNSDEPAMRVVSAEVVSDDDFDFEDTVNKARAVESVGENEEEQETPFPVQIGLRTLDVLFLVIEKVVLAVPTLISAAKIVSERLAQEKLAGGGSKGWDPIQNVQRGNKRY